MMLPGRTYIVAPKKTLVTVVKQSPVAQAHFPLVWAAWETLSDGDLSPEQAALEDEYHVALVKLITLSQLANAFAVADKHSRPFADWVLAHIGPPPYSEKAFDPWWEILDEDCICRRLDEGHSSLQEAREYLYSDSADSRISKQLNSLLMRPRDENEATQ